MKKLLATLAFALSAGAASAGDWYVTSFGGANWKEPYGSDGGNSTLTVNADAGYVVGAALGRKLDDVLFPGLRTEVELSYRSNAIDGLFDGPCEDYDINGHDSTFAAMLNVGYDFPKVFELRPYVMGGVGFAARRIAWDPAPSNWGDGFGTERQGFAWQVGAGVNYDISQDITLGVGYRYFQGVAINREAKYWKENAFMTADGDNHAVLAELTFHLN